VPARAITRSSRDEAGTIPLRALPAARGIVLWSCAAVPERARTHITRQAEIFALQAWLREHA
jgi:hypothetical protein